MNICLVSVGEKTREIGLRKSVGAKRIDIFYQFLTESICLCFCGGVLGIAGGWGAAHGMAWLAVRIVPIVETWPVVLSCGRRDFHLSTHSTPRINIGKPILEGSGDYIVESPLK